MTYQEPENLLTMLGLSPRLVRLTAPSDLMTLVDKQYLALSLLLHPDKGGNAERFGLVTAARDALKESPELLEGARRDLLKRTAIQEELDKVRWLLGNEDDARQVPKLLENIAGLLSNKPSHPTLHTLRGVHFDLWDGMLHGTLIEKHPELSRPSPEERFEDEDGEDIAPLSKKPSKSHPPEELALVKKIVAETQRLIKSGEYYVNAQTDALRKCLHLSLDVQPDGTIVRKLRGKPEQLYTDKVIIGITSHFLDFSATKKVRKELAGLEGVPGEKGSVVSSLSGKKSEADAELRAFLDGANPERIPLSQGHHFSRFLYTTISPAMFDYNLVSLNFPAGEEPYFRIEGRISRALIMQNGVEVDLVKKGAEDGTGDS